MYWITLLGEKMHSNSVMAFLTLIEIVFFLNLACFVVFFHEKKTISDVRCYKVIVQKLVIEEIIIPRRA